MIIGFLAWVVVFLGAAVILAAIVGAFTLAQIGVRRAWEAYALRSPEIPDDYGRGPPVVRKRKTVAP